MTYAEVLEGGQAESPRITEVEERAQPVVAQPTGRYPQRARIPPTRYGDYTLYDARDMLESP